MTNRQRRYEARQRDKGLRRVTVFVPEASVERLKAYAAKLRKEKEVTQLEKK